MRACPRNARETLSVAAVVLTVAATLLFLHRADGPDPRQAEAAQLRAEFDREKADLDRMQRQLAAYDAFNKAAADQIHLLASTNPNN